MKQLCLVTLDKGPETALAVAEGRLVFFATASDLCIYNQCPNLQPVPELASIVSFRNRAEERAELRTSLPHGEGPPLGEAAWGRSSAASPALIVKLSGLPAHRRASHS
jgi:hypothetical protein